MNSGERRADAFVIVASYDHRDPAAEALAAITSLVDDGSVQPHGATIVRRDQDGKISIDGEPGAPRHPAGWGALAGVAVAALFPPSLLAGALVGGAVGLATGGRRNRGAKTLTSATANTLPPNSYGVIAIVPALQVDALDHVLAESRRVTKTEIDHALLTHMSTAAGST